MSALTFTPSCLFAVLLVAAAATSTIAQAVSSSTPLPPLQWIRLDTLVGGSAPPPLKDATIGYDGARRLVVFGGESSAGVPQATTYILDLSTLTWRSPSPPNGLSFPSPPARSASLYGPDWASNFRSGHVVIGGKGGNGALLSDVWEFDYNYEYWAQVSISGDAPSARYGASGGIDQRVDSTLDQTNTFFLAGGTSSAGTQPLSDMWSLKLTGTLSPNEVAGNRPPTGEWTKISVDGGALPAAYGQGGTVVQNSIISYGGCTKGQDCAEQLAIVVDTDAGSGLEAPPCAAPRLGATVVPNMNTYSTNFQSQAFVLLGSLNTSQWQDADGLSKGEVDVLDYKQATWTRVLPAGDPASNPGYPSPRQGAVAVALSAPLIGNSRANVSDTIVFGGRDASGRYLKELWLLRAYNSMISGSSDHWAGYGSGELQTGINADGAGVGLSYLTNCASPKPVTGSAAGSKPTSADNTLPTSSTRTSAIIPSGTSTAPSDVTPNAARRSVSTGHKALAPISIVLVTVTVLLSSVASRNSAGVIRQRAILLLCGLAAFVTGLIALVLSFTSIHSPDIVSRLSRRAEARNGPHLKTGHGQAGLAFFIGLYILFPLFLLYPILSPSRHADLDAPLDIKPSRSPENDTGVEKLGYFGSSDLASPTPGSRHSFGLASAPLPVVRSNDSHGQDRASSDTDQDTIVSTTVDASTAHAAPSATASTGRSFSVTNRPSPSVRRHSTTGLAVFAEQMRYSRTAPAPSLVPRTLSEVNWLERRRSLTTVDELDYALTQMHRQTVPATPDTTDALNPRASTPIAYQDGARRRGSLVQQIVYIILHICIIGASAVTLHALWTWEPLYGFALFLMWMVLFYVFLVILFRRSRRRSRTRSCEDSTTAAAASSAPPTPGPHHPYAMAAADTRGPYLHTPPVRSSLYPPNRDDEVRSATSHGPLSTEYDSEDDEDEDARQSRIESEMARRDVSIVTVMRKPLFIVNPDR